jgi:DNA-directed RNA polymerase II subunit RPB4
MASPAANGSNTTMNGAANRPIVVQRPTPQTINALKANWLPMLDRFRTSVEEDAGNPLLLGDFDGVPTLSVSEARLLVDAIHAKRKTDNNRTRPDKDVVIKMQSYLESFKRFHRREQVTSVELLLATFPQINYFERSQLSEFKPPQSGGRVATPGGIFGAFWKRKLTKKNFFFAVTLCPGDAEEAKALIPSLQNKLLDEEMEQLIADINAIQRNG